MKEEKEKIEEYVRQNYFVEKLPHAEYNYRYDGWIAFVSYDGKVFDAPTKRTKLDNEFRERAPKVLVKKIELYNRLLKEIECLYCDKKMNYSNIFGYQYRSQGDIDGVICENEKCQQKADSEEIFAIWEEAKSGWPREDEFWGGPVDEVADLIRPYKTKDEIRKETDILLKKSEEKNSEKKEELEKEIGETEKSIKELLEKFRNIAPENQAEKLRIALSLTEFLVDNWSDYLIAKNLLRKIHNG